MTRAKAGKTLPLIFIGGLLGLALVVGCRKPAAAPPPAPPLPPPAPNVGAAEPAGPFAAARKTFDAKCSKCHSIGDSGGPMPGGAGPGGPGGGGPGGRKRGPNLAKVGADPKHTREWLMDYIRDPHTKNADAKMPKFAGQINDDDLGALADYLGSLRGT